jgi:hypothetical protein
MSQVRMGDSLEAQANGFYIERERIHRERQDLRSAEEISRDRQEVVSKTGDTFDMTDEDKELLKAGRRRKRYY